MIYSELMYFHLRDILNFQIYDGEVSRVYDISFLTYVVHLVKMNSFFGNVVVFQIDNRETGRRACHFAFLGVCRGFGEFLSVFLRASAR